MATTVGLQRVILGVVRPRMIAITDYPLDNYLFQLMEWQSDQTVDEVEAQAVTPFEEEPSGILVAHHAPPADNFIFNKSIFEFIKLFLVAAA